VRLIPSTIATAADPLGLDMAVRDDLDPSGRSADGLELVSAAMLHRLSEDTLLLTGAPDDQVEFGEDVRKWIGGAVSQDSLNARAPRLEEVLRRDPRIASIALSLQVLTGADASKFSFLIHVRGTTIRGQTIDRIVGVSAVSVEFLTQGR
jgi:hypothetical protein